MTALEIRSGPFINIPKELTGWKSFAPKITFFSIPDQADILFAYDLAHSAHKGQHRKSGEPYFMHPRETALILLYAGVRDADIIAAALLHDVVEDTRFLDKGPRAFTGRSDFERIQGAFNERVEVMVQNLTMLTEWEVGGDPEEAYLNALRESDCETLLIKMADRIHNIKTLGAMPIEKQRKKIIETREKYLPIFRQALLDYPKVAGILLQQLITAIREWESNNSI